MPLRWPPSRVSAGLASRFAQPRPMNPGDLEGLRSRDPQARTGRSGRSGGGKKAREQRPVRRGLEERLLRANRNPVEPAAQFLSRKKASDRKTRRPPCCRPRSDSRILYFSGGRSRIRDRAQRMPCDRSPRQHRS